MPIATISPQQALERIQAGSPLIDVRTPIEFAAVHAATAVLAPLDRLDGAALPPDTPEQPLVLICKSGKRAQAAAERLAKAGRQHLLVVAGGTEAWDAAGLPVERRSVISLERQVRIVAGVLVLTGTALGAFVHPGFIGLAGFVGAGLVFAGLTDWCGMGLLLARMPWNQVAASPCDQGSCPSAKA